MRVWIENFYISLLFGTLLFFVLFIPGVVIQYRRLGTWNARRLIGLGLVSLYAAALFIYTFVPLPGNPQRWCAAHRVGSNLIPFAWVQDLQAALSGAAVGASPTVVLLQAVFNIILFIPLGILAKRFFGWRLTTTMLVAAALTLGIETAQYTGFFGIYPCAIRVADIDDVILNFIGAALGYLLANIFLFWMPQAHLLHGRASQPRRITVARRLFGLYLDAMIVTIANGILIGVWNMVHYLVWRTPAPASALTDFIAPAIAVTCTLIIPGLVTGGSSPGKYIVWLRPVNNPELMVLAPLTRFQMIASATLGPALWFLATAAFPTGIQALASGALAVHVLSIFWSENLRGLGAVMLRTSLVDSRAWERVDPAGEVRQANIAAQSSENSLG